TGSDETEDKEVEKWEPGIYMDLSKDFFEEKIIDKQGEPELVSNESFVDYFRGVYFKVSSNNDFGSMPLIKMENAKIRVYYSSDPENDDDDDVERPSGTLDLELSGGTKVITATKEHSSYVQQQLAAQDSVNGSSRLLIQGGESILGIVKLFGEDSNDSGVA